MNKYLFFALFSVFASCTQEQITPNQITETSEISFRGTETVEVSCEISYYDVIIEDLEVGLTNFDSDISELAILENQSINFTNLSTGEIESFPAVVLSYEVIIEDLEVGLSVPSVDLNEYAIAENQVISFE